MAGQSLSFSVFAWQVNKTGYQSNLQCLTMYLQENNPKLDTLAQSILEDTPGLDPLGGSSYREYEPMTKRGLFRRFAELEETPEAVIEFANRYGMLGIERGRERFEDWHDRIRRMREMVEAYDHIKNGQMEAIDGGKSIYRNMNQHDAMFFFMMQLNYRLQGLASPVVVGVHLHEGELSQPGAVTFLPSSLLGALWLQFALEVTKTRIIKRCPVCNKQMLSEKKTDPGRARQQRSDKMYCSHACVVAAGRRKRNENNAVAITEPTSPASPLTPPPTAPSTLPGELGRS